MRVKLEHALSNDEILLETNCIITSTKKVRIFIGESLVEELNLILLEKSWHYKGMGLARIYNSGEMVFEDNKKAP
jgi:hypothetical protein